MHRRAFVAGAAAAVAARGVQAAPPRPAQPEVWPRTRFALNLYSLNALFKSGAVDLPGALDLAARLGFDAVDVTGYYFTGYPAPPEDAVLYRTKRGAHALGLAIIGTGVRNDFAQADAAARARDVALVGAWIDVAARLGAPVLRVFSGKAVPPGRTRAETVAWVADALKACARAAESRGVVLALQNHNDLLATADETLELRGRVASDWLGIHLDIGSFTAADPYAEIARVAPYAVAWQVKENVLAAGKPQRTDLPRLAGIVRSARWRGTLGLETLGPGDPRARLARFLAEARAAFA